MINEHLVKIIDIADKVIIGETANIRAQNLLELFRVMELRKAVSAKDLIAAEVMTANHVAESQGVLHEFNEILAKTVKQMRDQKFRIRYGFISEALKRSGILDLSNHSTKEDECLDLAKHLSAVIQNQQTPPEIYNAIVDDLGKKNLEPTVLYIPEEIAKVLCDE